jgi:hypothetical protein
MRNYEKGDEDGVRDSLVHFDQLINKTEQGKEKMDFSCPERVPVSESAERIREDRKKEACPEHEIEGRPGSPLSQVPEEFVPNAGGRTGIYFFPVPGDGFIRLFLDGKSRSTCMTDHPDHPDGVLLVPFVRLPDGSNDPSFKVGHPANIIDNGKIPDVVKEAVNGDIPAEGVFLRGPEAVRADDLSLLRLLFFILRSASESRNLDNLTAFKEDVNQAKTASDNPAVSKKTGDFMGMGIGDYVKVFRDFSQKEIAYATSYQAGLKSMMMKPVEDFQRLFIDQFS